MDYANKMMNHTGESPLPFSTVTLTKNEKITILKIILTRGNRRSYTNKKGQSITSDSSYIAAIKKETPWFGYGTSFTCENIEEALNKLELLGKLL